MDPQRAPLGSATAALTLNLHGFLPRSRANGPGTRAVVWVQGCSLGCPGCFNPESHPFTPNEVIAVDALFLRIRDLAAAGGASGCPIEGITLSGGEPLQQFAPVLALLRRLRRETPLSAFLFTGYTWDEVRRLPSSADLLDCLDVLITGRYDAARRVARGLLGSSNKTAHLLTARYTPSDLSRVPPAEVVVTRGGWVISTGIRPVSLDVISSLADRCDPDEAQ